MRKVEKIMEKIIGNEQEIKELLSKETVDDLYEFFLKKDSTLTMEEFDDEVYDILENYSETANEEIDQNTLEQISGGKNDFIKRTLAMSLSALTIGSAATSSAFAAGTSRVRSGSRSIAMSTKDKIKGGFVKIGKWLSAHKKAVAITGGTIGAAALGAIILVVAVKYRNAVVANRKMNKSIENVSKEFYALDKRIDNNTESNEAKHKTNNKTTDPAGAASGTHAADTKRDVDAASPASTTSAKGSANPASAASPASGTHAADSSSNVGVASTTAAKGPANPAGAASDTHAADSPSAAGAASTTGTASTTDAKGVASAASPAGTASGTSAKDAASVTSPASTTITTSSTSDKRAADTKRDASSSASSDSTGDGSEHIPQQPGDIELKDMGGNSSSAADVSPDVTTASTEVKGDPDSSSSSSPGLLNRIKQAFGLNGGDQSDGKDTDKTEKTNPGAASKELSKFRPEHSAGTPSPSKKGDESTASKKDGNANAALGLGGFRNPYG